MLNKTRGPDRSVIVLDYPFMSALGCHDSSFHFTLGSLSLVKHSKSVLVSREGFLVLHFDP